MQCEVCGSTEIRKTTDEVFECQSCGIQYSKSEVQKLLVEITGEVKIDRNEEVANMIKNVQRLYKNRDYDKVISSCDNILNMQPDNVEAILYSGYASAYNTTVANIRLGDAYRAANDAIKIQYEALGKSGDFFDFCSEVLAELNSITDTIFEFCRETIVSANVMNPANRDIFDSLKGGMDAKAEINDLQELVSMVVLNFLTKFDLLMIVDFSSAPSSFFINMMAVMQQQYRGSYRNKIPQVKMDLNRLILFELPKSSVARKKAESLCTDFSFDKFVKSDAECQQLINKFSSQHINKGKKTQQENVAKETTKSGKNSTTKKLKCDVFFEAFTIDLSDKSVSNPTKSELKALFETAESHPYDCVLHIEPQLEQQDYDEIEIIGQDYNDIVAVTFKRGEVIDGDLFNKSDGLEIVCTFLETGKCDMSKFSPFVPPQNPKKPGNAANWIHLFGIMGLTPYTFFLGIFTLCFVNKAKEENGGELSKYTKSDLKKGVIGFSVYTAVILFSIIIIPLLF